MTTKPTAMDHTLTGARPAMGVAASDLTGGEEPIVAELTGEELAEFRDKWMRNRAKIPYYQEQGRFSPQVGDQWRVHIDGILRFLDDYGDFEIQLMNYPNAQLTVLYSERYQQAFVVSMPEKPAHPGARTAAAGEAGRSKGGLWSRFCRLFGQG